jgi:hypothetical protein
MLWAVACAGAHMSLSPIGLAAAARAHRWTVRLHSAAMAVQRMIQGPQVDLMTSIVTAMADAKDPLAVAGILLRVRAGAAAARLVGRKQKPECAGCCSSPAAR